MIILIRESYGNLNQDGLLDRVIITIDAVKQTRQLRL
jgi:hypothetical protein